MTVTVQQILFTTETAYWHRLAAALSLKPPFAPEPGWAEFDGDGILAFHGATPAHPSGSVSLHLLVDDLDAAQAALAGFDVERGALEGVGAILTVRAASGVVVTVSGGRRDARSGDLAVQPVWFQPDIDEASRILQALGMEPRVVAERGGWVELAADGGGLVGLHSGDEPHLELSFLTSGDLDALVTRLRDAGFDAAIIDEAYARTIRVAHPGGGEELQINGVQDDLYGYRRV